MKKLLLVGYFGFDNLGDELLLISLLDFIKCNFRDIEPVVLYRKDLPSVYGADVIPRRRLLSGIIKSDGICFSGGSIIQDVTSIRSLLYYLGIVLIASLIGRPVIMISQGFGPIRTWIGKKLIRILNLVHSISVRDRDSFEFLNKSRIKSPRIYEGSDLVLFLNIDNFKIKDSSKNIDVIISIRESPNFKEKEFLSAFARFKKKNNLNIALFITHKEEDAKITERFATSLECEILTWDDPISAISLLSSARFIISMRLHPLIISSVLNIPFLGITYDPKVSSFISLFSDVYSLSDSSDASKIEDTLNTAWENKERTISGIIKSKNNLNRENTFKPLYDLYSFWFKDK